MATLPRPPFQNKVTDASGYMDRGWLAYFTGLANSLISGWVSSITGVANRIKITGTPAAPIIDIDPAYGNGFVTKSPDSADRNTVQPAVPTIIPLTLKGVLGQVADLQRFADAAGNILLRVDAAGNIYAGANLIFTGADATIRANTADESDTNRLLLSGGGGADATRGAFIQLNGNEFTNTPDADGDLLLAAGTGAEDSAGGKITLTPGGGSGGITIHKDGTVSIEGTTYATSLNLSGPLGFAGQTVNGLLFLNGSERATTASNLTFDGTILKGPKGLFISDFTLGATPLGAGAALALNAATGAMTLAPTTLAIQTPIASSATGPYEEGAFTATLTGVTASVTGTAKFVRIGKAVILRMPDLFGTSNSTFCAITGIPANITPPNTVFVPLPIYTDNSTLLFGSAASINSASTITLYANGAAAGWTNSATTKGISKQAFSYTLQ